MAQVDRGRPVRRAQPTTTAPCPPVGPAGWSTGAALVSDSTIEYLRTLVAGHDRGDWTPEQVVERLHQVIDPERIAGARPWADLQSTGLLWYLNRTALWPRGYAFALVQDQDGTVLGWDLAYDGSEPIASGDPDAEGDRLAAVERLLAEHRA